MSTIAGREYERKMTEQVAKELAQVRATAAGYRP